MAVKVILTPEADLDITEAYIWYERRRTGLGEEFLTAVDASIERIRRWPEMYAAVHEAYRRALTRRFPFALFYEYAEDTITVYAVFHTSRDPRKWRARLP
jgi:plasmid stabilization system protein ParE